MAKTIMLNITKEDINAAAKILEEKLYFENDSRLERGWEKASRLSLQIDKGRDEFGRAYYSPEAIKCKKISLGHAVLFFNTKSTHRLITRYYNLGNDMDVEELIIIYRLLDERVDDIRAERLIRAQQERRDMMQQK